MKKYNFLWFCILLILVPGGKVIPAGSAGFDSALSEKFRSLNPGEHVPVIIRLTGKGSFGATPPQKKKARRSKIIKALKDKADAAQKHIMAALRQKKAERVKPLWVINAIAASVRAGDLAELAALPGVERIVFDAVVHAPETFPSPLASASQWNISAVHADDLWTRGYTGQGVVVANMDTGVDGDHPDLIGRWRGGTNSWFTPYARPENASFCKTPGRCTACERSSTPCDVDGHGTGTMGIMTGGDAGGTAIGVAPGALWTAVKIFNDAGESRYSVIHEAFQWLLDPDRDPGTDDAPDIVNGSWGLQDPAHDCNTEFQEDVQVLKAANILLSFSAGNDGPNGSTGLSPANYPESFSVGATDSANTIWNFSSRGPSACGGSFFPTVAAPGVNVLTSDLFLGMPGPYVTVSGTSYAAPHVSGALALLLSAFPGQAAGMAEAALTKSATDLGMPGTDNDSGYGLIDVARAYSFLLKSALGVYRDGTWFLDANRSSAWGNDDRTFTFGIGSDIPVVGDWSGKRVANAGVVRGNTWFLDINGNGAWDAGDTTFEFGIAGDIPVTGDWTENGITGIGVYRSGSWFLDMNGDGAWEDDIDVVFHFGIQGDIPVTGDWNGDGKTEVGVYRQGAWYLDMNGNGSWDAGDTAHYFGIATDTPVTGDWTGDEKTKIGVYRGGIWYLDLNGNGDWDGDADAALAFGIPGDLPVAGRW